MSDANDVAERVKKIVVEHLGIDEAKVTVSASLMDDLGVNLAGVEVVMKLLDRLQMAETQNRRLKAENERLAGVLGESEHI